MNVNETPPPGEMWFVGEPQEFGKLAARSDLQVVRVKTPAPIGHFMLRVKNDTSEVYPPGMIVGATFQHHRCDQMHTLSWREPIKWAYLWHSIKRIWKTKRRDWWNAGL